MWITQSSRVSFDNRLAFEKSSRVKNSTIDKKEPNAQKDINEYNVSQQANRIQAL